MSKLYPFYDLLEQFSMVAGEGEGGDFVHHDNFGSA